ncbi:hypothetical protein [Bacillus seohaeanensis]|uniref:Group-specific protein n=1 Tax=Bacillus seohaeanensis TaxID=284580 RepID=A0ABW5RNN8_9BACI
MNRIVLSIVFITTFLVSIFFFFKRRKKAGVTGIKSALTSICFFLIAIVNFTAYWLNSLGIVSWLLTFSLILLGAYFTKYLPPPSKVN